MRWTAVVNPTAGRGRARRRLPELRRALEARGVTVFVSSDQEDGQRIARDAFARGNGVVACGGDGTISALAAIAAEEDAPLAIVPTGAGNDLARELRLDPRRPLDAVALLETGHLARMDLGHVQTAAGTACPFTTVANVGFDAEANRWANGVRWASGSTLYVLAMLRTLAAYRPRPMRLTVDDEEWRGDAWLVAIGNSRWYAGGMKITPDAAVDDGMLDVCVVTGVPTRRLLWNFPRVFRGTHTKIDGVLTFRGATVEIAPDGDAQELEVWASGERVGPLPARLTILPRSLSLLVPADSKLPAR